jgi:tetratricopeptide (TPR) repeat protein
MSTGEPDRAELRFRRAVAAAESALARTVVRVNLAECLLRRGRTLEAAEWAREAERIALLEGVGGRLPEVYRLLGAIAARTGAEDALVFWERALEAGREFTVPPYEEALTLEAYGRWRAEHGEPHEGARLLRRAADRLTAAERTERARALARLADELDPTPNDKHHGDMR